MSPSSHAPLMSWTDQSHECVKLIAAVRSPLKILLKTKNDPWFLRDWLAHHTRLVDKGCVIVFDNESDDPKVLQTYAEYTEFAQVFRFRGRHNDFHNVDAMPRLYKALAESAEYFMFLDTDEFCYWVDGPTSFSHDLSTAIAILASDGDFMPGTWLPNVTGSADSYWIGGDRKVLLDGLRWGKPLLRASKMTKGFINHNLQCVHAGFVSAPCNKLIIQHRIRLYPLQRISANVNKLAQRGIIVHRDSTEADLQKELSVARDENVKLYLNEIIELKQQAEVSNQGFAPNSSIIKFIFGGELAFSSDKEAALLADFINGPTSFQDYAFSL